MYWKHGYHADSGYTFGYYAETMPARLRWAALIQGQSAPERGFRYLDAGCGQGLNLILAAAAHPDAEFVGLDFMPGHIAHARQLAEDSGLTNVTFIEADFVQIAEDPMALDALGTFDYAVCHGITTWIAPAVKSALFRLIGHVLKPGGLFYNSYNTFPGWLSVAPFQHLVLLEQQQRSGPDALNAARTTVETLMAANPALKTLHPGLEARLNSFKGLDAAYLVQEYNNQYWQPVFVTDMMAALSAVKLDYLGTATLSEAFPGLLPEKIRELLGQQASPLLKAQLLDYAINQSFRRDLYVKGKVTSWPQLQNRSLLATRFKLNPLVKRPDAGSPYKLNVGMLEVGGKPEFYSAVLDQLATPEGLPVSAIRYPVANAKLGDVCQMVSLLLQGGWIVPFAPAAPSGAHVNAAITGAVSDGAPYSYVSTPKTGGAVAVGGLDMLIVQAALSGRPRGEWIDHILKSLAAQGKRLNNKEGTPVTDPAMAQSLLTDQMQRFQPVLDHLKETGAL